MKILVGSVGIMLIGFILVIVGVLALTPSTSDVPHPLFFYADTFIGRPVSAIEVYGFFCTDTYDYSTPDSLRCMEYTASGPYSEIRVILSEGAIEEVAFTMQNDAVQIGHLILFWGKPEVRRSNQSIRFYWHGGRIIAVASTGNGIPSPSLSVWKVYFLEVTA